MQQIVVAFLAYSSTLKMEAVCYSETSVNLYSITRWHIPEDNVFIIITVLKSKSKSKSHYGQQSIGQFVLVSGAHLGLATNFSFPLRFSLDSCRFVILKRPVWREDGSVIYCCCWSSPAQSRYGLPSLTRGRICLLSVSMFIRYLHKIITLSVFDTVQGRRLIDVLFYHLPEVAVARCGAL
jgi:hypothetical protein